MSFLKGFLRQHSAAVRGASRVPARARQSTGYTGGPRRGGGGRGGGESQGARIQGAEIADDSAPTSATRTTTAGTSSSASARSKKPGYTKSCLNVNSQPEGLISLKKALDLDGVAFALVKFAPGQGYTFTHSHDLQEEIYVCHQGRGLIQLGDEVLGMEPGDVVRVSPETRRSVYATPRGGTGYAMRTKQEHFVLHVFGATPSPVEDGNPHYEDIPSWFVEKPGIADRNRMLKERYDRMRVYNSDREGASGHRTTQELHRTKYREELTRNEGGEGGGALPEILVSSLLVDTASKKVLVLDREGGSLGLPSGAAAGDELPEEALSRELAEQLGIEAHPESFESFCFGTTRQNGSDGPATVNLIYTCDDWCGEPRGGNLSWLTYTQLKGKELDPILRQNLAKVKACIRKRATSLQKDK